MNKYYLRFEGVNMDGFVYDTNDLNTIRGGGLLLLEAAERKVGEILQDFDKCCSFETISKGASWGLFEFEAEDDAGAISVQERVRDYFSTHIVFRHATFVVDVLNAPKRDTEFISVRDKLTVLNRWQQMKSPSIAVPQPGEDICCFDKVRPASRPERIAGTQAPVSASVSVRQDFGKKQKKSEFYSQLTGLQGLSFTRDLTELSEDEDKGLLNKKIAVIYIDGNGFGSVQRELCRTKIDQKKFDKMLREGQSRILKKLISTASKDRTGAWKKR